MDNRRGNKLHYMEINRNSRVGVNLGGVGVEYSIERQGKGHVCGGGSLHRRTSPVVKQSKNSYVCTGIGQLSK